MSVLELNNLTIGYRKKKLAENINLKIEKGQFVTIMGENGCGKSTLLHTLAGVVPAKAGSVSFWGQPLEGHEVEVQNKVGWVIAEREHYGFSTTAQSLFKSLSLVYENWDQELCDQLCEGFNLDVTKGLNTLSSGEHSKVKLVKALAFHPRLMVLDELTANLSENSKDVVLKHLIDVFSEGKISIIYVCHNSAEALQMSDSIYELNSQGLVLKGGAHV